MDILSIVFLVVVLVLSIALYRTRQALAEFESSDSSSVSAGRTPTRVRRRSIDNTDLGVVSRLVAAARKVSVTTTLAVVVIAALVLVNVGTLVWSFSQRHQLDELRVAMDGIQTQLESALADSETGDDIVEADDESDPEDAVATSTFTIPVADVSADPIREAINASVALAQSRGYRTGNESTGGVDCIDGCVLFKGITGDGASGKMESFLALLTQSHRGSRFTGQQVHALYGDPADANPALDANEQHDADLVTTFGYSQGADVSLDIMPKGTTIWNSTIENGEIVQFPYTLPRDREYLSIRKDGHELIVFTSCGNGVTVTPTPGVKQRPTPPPTLREFTPPPVPPTELPPTQPPPEEPPPEQPPPTEPPPTQPPSEEPPPEVKDPSKDVLVNPDVPRPVRGPGCQHQESTTAPCTDTPGPPDDPADHNPNDPDIIDDGCRGDCEPEGPPEADPDRTPPTNDAPPPPGNDEGFEQPDSSDGTPTEGDNSSGGGESGVIDQSGDDTQDNPRNDGSQPSDGSSEDTSSPEDTEGSQPPDESNDEEVESPF